MLRKNPIKGAIVGAGYTQKTFAARLGVSQNTLNAKLNGKSSFTMEEAERVCALLDVVEPAEKAALFFTGKSQK